MGRQIERFRTPLTTLGGALLGMALVLLYFQLNPPDGRYSAAEIRALADEQIAEITPTPPLAPAIFALLRPSVVLISRDVVEEGRPGQGLGSGVVIDLNGSILTAYHVVEGVPNVTVRFYDGTTLPGTVVQQQPERDLAVIQVSNMPSGVEAATLSGGARQGEPVLAIGSPFALEGSVSAGIISALGRSFVVEETGQVLNNMIQFDAAVNPGNSGGPLIDYNGHVIGIVTGLINPTSDEVFVGIGFAVPIESASGIVPPIG